MDPPDEPKRNKHGATKLGGLLLLGGIIALQMARRTESIYENVIREPGSTSWATGLGWIMVLAGGITLLIGLVLNADDAD